MYKRTSFLLRISTTERRRAQRLARRMGVSENRLYSDLIREGRLPMREQMAYFEKLRSLHVPASDGLALLDRARAVDPDPADAIGPRGKR
ncbi:MAG: hypothetical protein JO307_00915 [Bryobacterales bacterium]|nr:hypothetical protein [Bryobacterales bacterium]MBV9396681.1 hypothetical protein [Bryobacterales bacterium]